ncbi:MAG: ATP-dependent DNA ligase [Methanomassiliicoccales archaeon]
MLYRELVRAYEALESTDSRLEMTKVLSDLFQEVDCEILDKVIYFTEGKLYPDFYPGKLGIADKLLMRTLAFTSGEDRDTVHQIWLREGDPGLVAEELLSGKKQTSLFSQPLTVERVYSNLERVVRAEGTGSQDTKMKLLAELFHDASPLEGRYLGRIVTGRMRLGVASQTVLDALAQAFCGKEHKARVERAFNITSDLGTVGKTLCREGVEALDRMRVEVGRPIRAMLAERLSSAEEILERMGGRCAFEYKYDGVRVQAHIGEGIRLYSRRLEDLTSQFPDVVEALEEAFRGETAILEGECVPVDVNTGEMLPFQQVSHRRGRKYDLEGAMEEYPVMILLFDCLYLDGEDITRLPLLDRRKALEGAVRPGKRVKSSEMRIIDDPGEVDAFFERALQEGCEGLMAKHIGEGSVYRAGARGYMWIKYKREYRSEMTDTVDLVVVGAFAGRGRRRGLYGALLMATYQPETDRFETVCKLGSGFDDRMLASLPDILDPFLEEGKHPLVESTLEADFWFRPEVVMEVLGSEITLSPTHTSALGRLREGSGLAIRFPRFTGRLRRDKGPRDATTSEEMLAMYREQLKHVDG